ncbi:hypothetical protein MTBBW1_340056 [Desulfamplus magnetovallimortis]|uniref:Uncharacterized protein n=1 Tax=Desulfamplus magnetovallimortis TaxID=1246637 RepID=A0A1W1HGA2_9BACT|nr:hypothetical protein MTBBW1_340056 [Desulfamplus magnetovallimortis]
MIKKMCECTLFKSISYFVVADVSAMSVIIAFPVKTLNEYMMNRQKAHSSKAYEPVKNPILRIFQS